VSRPDWTNYFLKITMAVAERSTCNRHHVGAIAVRDRHILATGYNGAPSGLLECSALGCLRDEQSIPSGQRHEVCRAVHAEQNVIAQAALHNTNLKDATLYCTHSPCRICAKLLVQVGIKEFVTYGTYADDTFTDLFRAVNIRYVFVPCPPAEIKVLA
jgi:dCMP deaminase